MATFPAEPSVLVWGREESGLGLEDAARFLKISPEKLVALESGKEQPTLAMLKRIAAAYNLSLVSLLTRKPAEATKKPEDFRTVAGRAPSFNPETLLAIRNARRWQESISDIVAEAPNLYKLADLPIATVESDPEVLARNERRRLGASIQEQVEWDDTLDAFRHWRWRIESLGILVFAMKMPRGDCRGFSLWEGTSIPVITVNSGENEAAQIFTLFHEYAHLLLRQAGICNQRENVDNAAYERFCNIFAANILMPQEAIPLRTWSLNDLKGAANRLKVSQEALALRLEELQMVPRGFYQSYISQYDDDNWVRPTRRKGGGPGFYQRRYLNTMGSRYVSTALTALKEGLINDIEADELLDTRPKHFAALERDLADFREKYGATP